MSCPINWYCRAPNTKPLIQNIHIWQMLHWMWCEQLFCCKLLPHVKKAVTAKQLFFQSKAGVVSCLAQFLCGSSGDCHLQKSNYGSCGQDPAKQFTLNSWIHSLPIKTNCLIFSTHIGHSIKSYEDNKAGHDIYVLGN